MAKPQNAGAQGACGAQKAHSAHLPGLLLRAGVDILLVARQEVCRHALHA